MRASRRDLIGGGLAALAMAGAARAETLGISFRDTTPRAEVLDTPALKGNSLARGFKQPPAGLITPKVKIERASGTRDLRLQPGLTLVSLWAPWCAPCLQELKDLAEVRQAYDGERFRILPVLTGPKGKVTLDDARAVLAKAGAQALEAAIDRSPGSNALHQALTERENPVGGGVIHSLPCNLLVDGDGRVLARQFGAPLDIRSEPGQAVTQEMKANARTKWVSAEGHALLGALQRGEIAKA
jgi:thiol-disulfide isomerase/thioredoxin